MDRTKLTARARHAIELFEQQLRRLDDLKDSNASDPRFIVWKDTTKNLLARFAPASTHAERFGKLYFRAFPRRARIGRPFPRGDLLHRQHFLQDCQIAKECLTAVVEEIENFDLNSPGEK